VYTKFDNVTYIEYIKIKKFIYICGKKI